MPIRLAHYADCEAIAQILTAAFWDEDVVGRQMHPRRDEYPGDVFEFWRRRVRTGWWDWSHVFVVATAEQDGGEGSEVVGVANWTRRGEFGGALSRWDPRRFLKYFAGLYNSVSSFFWPDRAANPSMLNVFLRASPFFAHHWSGARARCWSLDSLGVKPEYQRKGVGRQLVQWGLECARQDGVAASVVSADGRENFYKACGFNNIVGNVCDGEGNPMADFKGGTILFTDLSD